MKDFIREMILPAFWILVFIMLPRKERKGDEYKNSNRIQLKIENLSGADVIKQTKKVNNLLSIKINIQSAIRS